MKKYRNYNNKYLQPLQVKLNVTKNRMEHAVGDDVRSVSRRDELKAALEELERIGSSKENIDKLERFVKRRKMQSNRSRSAWKEYIFLNSSSLWRARMAIKSGAKRKDIRNDSSVWSLLVNRLDSAYDETRYTTVCILLLFGDDEKLTDDEKLELRNFKEIADFLF